MTLGGRQQVLVWHGEALAGVESFQWPSVLEGDAKPLYGMSIGLPRVFENHIHVMGFNRFSATYQVAPDGLSAHRLWGGDVRKGMGGVLNTAHPDPRATCIRLAEGNGFTVPIFVMVVVGGKPINPSRIDTAIDLETGPRHSPFIIPSGDTLYLQ